MTIKKFNSQAGLKKYMGDYDSFKEDMTLEDRLNSYKIMDQLKIIEEDKEYNLQDNINELIKKEYKWFFKKEYDTPFFPKTTTSKYGSVMDGRRKLFESVIYLKSFKKGTVFEEVFHWCLYNDYFKNTKDGVYEKLSLSEITEFRSTLTQQHYIIGSLIKILLPEHFDFFLSVKTSDKELFRLFEEYGSATLEKSRKLSEVIIKNNVEDFEDTIINLFKL